MSAAIKLFNEQSTFSYQSRQSRRLLRMMLFSLFLHITILFGVTFEFPTPDFERIASSLEVVLVNSETRLIPVDTELLAQSSLDGGGNVDANRRAKTPFPVLPQSKPARDPVATEEKVKQLEQETQKLLTALQSEKIIEPIEAAPDQASEQSVPTGPVSSDLLQRSLDIARLKAQIAEDHDAYQKRPKRKFVGARATEYRFARYVEDWRMKVERIGNLNYPEDAKKEKIYGNLQLTVGIRADGSLESIGINRSSGFKILDDAAIRIVRLAGKNGFSPFPPDISRDTDILHITRTWVFARSDTLTSR
ncbi:protein TonB [Nitrosomonas sp. Nm51]|uniref:energy transducer TonB n=1 Tax=Nitrosomonas sp. Nm51 TaxID=133720 RepID=UPI0008CE3157|nr:energy transducer TonB [Nitrosomonas sp. Nm51]SER68776.1 protein TonB [Nitrosomonas sp. Nm51]